MKKRISFIIVPLFIILGLFISRSVFSTASYNLNVWTYYGWWVIKDNYYYYWAANNIFRLNLSSGTRTTLGSIGWYVRDAIFVHQIYNNTILLTQRDPGGYAEFYSIPLSWGTPVKYNGPDDEYINELFTNGVDIFRNTSTHGYTQGKYTFWNTNSSVYASSQYSVWYITADYQMYGIEWNNIYMEKNWIIYSITKTDFMDTSSSINLVQEYNPGLWSACYPLRNADSIQKDSLYLMCGSSVYKVNVSAQTHTLVHSGLPITGGLNVNSLSVWSNGTRLAYVQYEGGSYNLKVEVLNSAPTVSSISSTESYISSWNQSNFPLKVSGINESDANQNLSLSYSFNGSSYSNVSNFITTKELIAGENLSKWDIVYTWLYSEVQPSDNEAHVFGWDLPYYALWQTFIAPIGWKLDSIKLQMSDHYSQTDDVYIRIYNGWTLLWQSSSVSGTEMTTRNIPSTLSEETLLLVIYPWYNEIHICLKWADW
jgi:hypothetical protein